VYYLRNRGHRIIITGLKRYWAANLPTRFGNALNWTEIPTATITGYNKRTMLTNYYCQLYYIICIIYIYTALRIGTEIEYKISVCVEIGTRFCGVKQYYLQLLFSLFVTRVNIIGFNTAAL